MDTPTPLADLLRELTPTDLRNRLAALDAERKAISVFLRSVAARERALRRRSAAAEGGSRAK
jgi:hypothetical protein